jgi:hypothetical protein
MGLDTKTYWLTDRQSQCDFALTLTWGSFSYRSAVEWSKLVGKWVSEWVRLRWFSPCELLLLEPGRWGTAIVQEPRVRGMPAVGSCYQTMTGEDIADWEDLVHAIVNCRVCELAVLQLLVRVVMSCVCKCSINPIPTHTLSTVTPTGDNIFDYNSLSLYKMISLKTSMGGLQPKSWLKVKPFILTHYVTNLPNLSVNKIINTNCILKSVRSNKCFLYSTTLCVAVNILKSLKQHNKYIVVFFCTKSFLTIWKS